MRRLLLIVLIVVVTCVVSVSTLLVAARSQPLPDHLVALHFDQCKPPCWIGIKPGQIVRPGAVEAALKTDYPAPQYSVTPDEFCVTSVDDCYVVRKMDQPLFRVTFRQGSPGQHVSNTITAILLTFNNGYTQDSTYAIGDFYALLGEPVISQLTSSLKYPRQGQVRSIIYQTPEGVINLVGFDGDLTATPEKRLSGIEFATLDFFKEYQSGIESRIYPWMGFMSAARTWTKLCERKGLC